MDQIRELPLAIAIATLFVIVMLRANGTYWLGRVALRGGKASERVDRILSGPRVERAQRLISRLGIAAVPLCFLTVGLQTVVLVTAGLSRMPQRWFLPAVTVGCVMWAVFYATVGMVGFQVIWSLVTD